MPAVYNSTAPQVPKAIIDLNTITSSITISDSYAIGDLDVSLDIDHTWDSDLDVFLIAPDGTRIELFSAVGLDGDDFDDTILDAEAADLIADEFAPFAGRFRPAGALESLYGTDINGTWLLEIRDVFGADDGTLNRWSLSVAPASAPPVPDLVGVSLNMVETVAQWGGPVTVDYTIGNTGAGAAGPFRVEVYLSNDSRITPSDTLLGWFDVASLAAGAQLGGTFNAVLPGSPGSPPAGFDDPDNVTIGFLLDSQYALVEDKSNSSNQGSGLDRDVLAIAVTAEQLPDDNNTQARADGIALNVAVTGEITAGDVDWFEFQLDEPGYLTLAVEPGPGSALDSRAGLYNVPSLLIVNGMRVGGGGLLIHSDDQADGTRDPRFTQYLLPGTYYIEVAAGGLETSAGTYVLRTQFTADSTNPYDELRNIPSSLRVGDNPYAVITADFNRDDILDLATANHDSADVTVLLGIGDGTFKPVARPLPEKAGRFVVGVPGQITPTSLRAVDFNGDGRLDLIVVDSENDLVRVLPGVGDGTFLDDAASIVPDGLDPQYLVGLVGPTEQFPLTIPDGGTLTSTLVIPELPRQGALTDVNVALDIVHNDASQLTVVLEGPDGTRVTLFENIGPRGHQGFFTTTLDDQPVGNDALVAIPIENGRTPYIGWFTPQSNLPQGPQFLSAFNGLNAEGDWKLHVTDGALGDIGWLVNWGLTIRTTETLADGTTRDQQWFFGTPATFADGDFNRDGTPDRVTLAAANQFGQPPYEDYLELFVGVKAPNDAQVDAGRAPILGINRPIPVQLFATAIYLRADRNPSNPSRATPLVANLNGDRFPDVVVLSGSGDILVRYGQADGSLGPPQIVNDGDNDPARAVIVVREGARARLASLDLRGDRVSLFVHNPVTGQWDKEAATLSTGLLPVRIAAADLNGDGLSDLIVGNAFFGSISVFLGQADGGFLSLGQRKVGITVSDVVIADVNNDQFPDLLATDQVSGAVSVLVNMNGVRLAAGQPADWSTAGQVFVEELRFHAGGPSAAHPEWGIYGVVEAVSNVINEVLRDTFQLPVDAFPPQYFGFSSENTASAVGADFNGDGVLDIVTTNRGTDRVDFVIPGGLGLLLGKKVANQPTGSFLDPQAIDLGDGSVPTVVQVADFDGDSRPDLAVLDEKNGAIFILLNDGSGQFVRMDQDLDEPGVQDVLAGNAPTGFSIEDLTGDGRLDLVVGNEFGDLLVIPGNGDGTFQQFVRSRRDVPFVVTDLATRDVIAANQALDLAQSYERRPGSLQLVPVAGTFKQAVGLLIAPGDLDLADLDRDGDKDLIVANTGSNTVTIILGLPAVNSKLRFDLNPDAIQTFYAGTNPVALNVLDLNGDRVLDLAVANEGSNDVSILFGEGAGGNWRFNYGPRLDAGGIAPSGLAFRDLIGDGTDQPDGTSDLVVTHRGGVSILPGTGAGFFNDSDLRVLATANRPFGVIPDLRPSPGLIQIPHTGGVEVLQPGPTGPVLTTFFTVPRGQTATAITSTTIRGQNVVAVANSGSVSVFFENDDGSFQERIFDGIGEPGDLEFVGDSELYVSARTGDGIDVQAYSLFGPPGGGLPPPGLPPGGGDPPPPGSFPDQQPIDGSIVFLVGTLLSGSGPEDAPGDVGPGGNLFAVGLGPGLALVADALAGGGGGFGDVPAEGEGEQAAEAGRSLNDFISGFDEMYEMVRDDVRELEKADDGPAVPPPEALDPLVKMGEALAKLGESSEHWLDVGLEPLESAYHLLQSAAEPLGLRAVEPAGDSLRELLRILSDTFETLGEQAEDWLREGLRKGLEVSHETPLPDDMPSNVFAEPPPARDWDRPWDAGAGLVGALLGGWLIAAERKRPFPPQQ